MSSGIHNAKSRQITTVAIAVCLFASVASAQSPPGDVTGNGYISSRDVWMARDYIAGYAPLTEEEQNRADINVDSGVDVADLLGIVNANEATTPMLFISQPQPGDRWPRGTTQGITWESAGPVAEPLTVTLLSSGSTLLTIADATSNSGVFLWEIPSDSDPGDAYAIRISSPTPGIVDETSTFSILGDTTIPPPPTKLVNGWLVLPTETPLEPTSLTLYATGGGAPIMGDWSFTGLEMWNQGEGQFVFLETNDGAEVMMGYVEPDVVTSGVLALTPGHHAEAAIAFSPALFSLVDAERREVLAIARVHQDFPTLVVMIIQVLKTDPLSLPDYGANPHIYDLAATIASDAYDAWSAAPAPGADASVESASSDLSAYAQTTYGPVHHPHFEHTAGNDITAVNPDVLIHNVVWGQSYYYYYHYYYYRSSYWRTRLANLQYEETMIAGVETRDSEPVRKDIRLTDGDRCITFIATRGSQYEEHGPIRNSSRANLLKATLLAFTALAPPGTEMDIDDQAILATLNPTEHSDRLLRIWTDTTLDSELDWLAMYSRVVDEVLLYGSSYTDSGVEHIAKMVFDMPDHQVRALHRYIRSASRYLKNYSQSAAVMESASDQVSFYAKWTRIYNPTSNDNYYYYHYYNWFRYCFRFENGVLVNCWWDSSPNLSVVLSDRSPNVGDTVTFDCSGTTDDQDPLSSLWFYYWAPWDNLYTGYVQGKTTFQRTHDTTGPKYLDVWVHDTTHRWDHVDTYYYVFDEPTATVEIDVTPDEGSWSLLGPGGFDTLRGSGDRIGPTAIVSAMPGAYTLVCDDNVQGYDPPEQETRRVVDEGTIRFDAAWIEEEYNTITIMLPGDLPMHLGRVPLGPFEMGSPLTERSRDGDETTTHPVTFADDYFIGITEVTQAQWTSIMIANFARGSGRGPDYPIYNVTWNSIVANEVNFLQRLNRYLINTGQLVGTIRLPSEAEWEKACRADTTTRFYFGDSLGCNDWDTDCAAGVMPGNRSDYMWFGFNSTDPTRGTKEVGQKGANALNLYDMHGNVMEWCQDYYHLSYVGAPSDGSAWVDPPGSYRVLRGGAWDRYAEDCRSANRMRTYPNRFLSGTGFRVALDGSAD